MITGKIAVSQWIVILYSTQIECLREETGSSFLATMPWRACSQEITDQ